MTAAARNETSGKLKPVLAASTKRSAAARARAEKAAEESAPDAVEVESVEVAEEAEELDPVEVESETIAAEPEPSEPVQPEDAAEELPAVAASEPTSEDVPASEPAAEETVAPETASPETAAATLDSREENSRFRIFVIDSGWNHPASKVLNENLDLIHALTHEDPIYILDKAKSIELLRKNKKLIGHDPIIAVHDLSPRTKRGKKTARGFRLHLGLQEGEAQCLSALKMFSRFINTHRDAKDLEADVRHKLHKQGLTGAIEIVGEVAQVAAFEG